MRRAKTPIPPTNQNRTIMLPMDPVFTPNPSVDLLNTLGPVGIAINGVALYNPYDGGGVDAPSTICMDAFKGHPSPDGSYHYHQWSPRFDGTLGNGHSELIGYGYDGFPVFGPLGVCRCFGQRLDRGKPIGRVQWARRPCLRLALSRCGLRARERYRCWRRS